MKFRKFAFVALLGSATALIVGCGDEKDPRLSNSDVEFIKQQRLQQQYGSGTTVTVTTTNNVVSYVTVTNTTTTN